MIKINKNIEDVPESLIPAFTNLFVNNRIPRSSRMTHQRRMELIECQTYIDNNKYNSRYKKQDIIEKLNVIYNGKCAFCEQKVEQLHVEHFRPKMIYYWMAYSWDNLIFACPKCNSYKGVHFELNGVRCFFINNENNLRNINNLSNTYNIKEQPQLVNPEITDPHNLIVFYKNGKIDSFNLDFKYTISTCKLDRKYLNDARRKIIDTFKNEIIAELVNSKDKTSQRHAIEVLVRRFIHASNEQTNEFIAFRKYSISNKWLNEIINEVTS